MVYVENGGGYPPIFQIISPFFPFFVHYFLENVTREPPITPQGGITTGRQDSLFSEPSGIELCSLQDQLEASSWAFSEAPEA